MSETTTVNAPPRMSAPQTVQGELVEQQSNGPLPSQRRVPLGGLAGALAAAQQKCKAATKDSVNTFHRYRYASAEAIITEAKEALSDTGLSLIPVEQTLDVTPAPRSQDARSQEPDRYELRRKFLLLHTSGESLPLMSCWPVVPEKGRPVDKATAIAATSSLAYLLRDLLLMPRINNEDDLPARADKPVPPPPQQSSPPPQEDPRPNPSTPVSTQEPGRISEEQRAELGALYRQHNRTPADVQTLLKILGVPVTDKIPPEKFDWVKRALTEGLVSDPVRDRICLLINQMGLDWAVIRDRLQAKYQVSSVGHLLASQAAEVAAAMETAAKAKPPQPAGAA